MTRDPRKLLVVCGDSWMAPLHHDLSALRASNSMHFSQILSEKIGYELLNLAQGGVNNYCIAAQIESAIKLKPSLVIFNTTAPNRLEIRMTASRTNHKYEILNFIHHNYKYIRERLGEANAIPSIASIGHVGDDSFNAQTHNATEIDSKFGDLIKLSFAKKREALKGYITELLDYDIAYKYNTALMYMMVHKLILSEINFVCMIDFLEMKSHCNFFNETNYIIDFKENLEIAEREAKEAGFQSIRSIPYSFHTFPSRQYVYVNTIYDVLQKRNLV